MVSSGPAYSPTYHYSLHPLDVSVFVCVRASGLGSLGSLGSWYRLIHDTLPPTIHHGILPGTEGSVVVGGLGVSPGSILLLAHPYDFPIFIHDDIDILHPIALNTLSRCSSLFRLKTGIPSLDASLIASPVPPVFTEVSSLLMAPSGVQQATKDTGVLRSSPRTIRALRPISFLTYPLR